MAVSNWAFNLKTLIIDPDISKNVDYIDVVLELTDYEGTVYFTDIMLQGGAIPTSWVGHVSEIRWCFDNA